MIRSEAIFALLRIQKHLPYSHFSEKSQSALTDVIRFFDLKTGETISLTANGYPIYVSALSGIIEVDGANNTPITVHQGETKLIPCGAILNLRATTGTKLCVADSEHIDELTSFDAIIDSDTTIERRSIGALERARLSSAFGRVPLQCVEEALRRMGHMTAPAGSELIHQGDHGDLFYVLVEGKAAIWQSSIYDNEPQMVGELVPGDAFGEEALVLGGTRSATVRITEDAEFLTLGMEDFQSLIFQELVDEIEAPVAHAMLKSGYKLLDVRYIEEYEDACIPESTLIPLSDLRMQMDELDISSRWIVYCRSGKRSAVATLLLKQRGFQAVSLKGGISVWPYETEPGAIT